MTAFDPQRFGPAIEELLSGDRLSDLGPGRPRLAARPLLQALDVDWAVDRDMARACLAGLWLLHDFLDESHTISQDIPTSTGSFWHAIMHRREPDPGNSKYWWRRVGQHPVLAQLRERAPELGYSFTSAEAFVDFCERVRGSGSPDEALAQRVQRLEWELLFAWCFASATATG